MRAIFSQLCQEHADPPRLGLAVAVGIVVGCSPFFGLHFWIGLGLALLLRLNKVAVFLGSQISIPPLAPLLGFLSVQIGSYLLQGQWVTLGVDDFTLSRLPELLKTFLLSWVLGGFVVGVVLALPGFLITWAVIRRRRARPFEAGDQAWRETLRHATELYREAPRKHRGYVRFKLPMDPVYRQVCEGLPSVDRIVDLGTGLGSLPALLALRAQGREILAVDWDEEKIATARLACRELPAVSCLQADVHEYAIPVADVICLIDVLHYYPLDRQRRLVKRAVKALRPGGTLVIRETDRGSRSLVTQWIEGAAVRLGWNKGPGLCYRTRQELVDELEGLGLSCATEGASSKVHRGNILLWARAIAKSQGSS